MCQVDPTLSYSRRILGYYSHHHHHPSFLYPLFPRAAAWQNPNAHSERCVGASSLLSPPKKPGVQTARFLQDEKRVSKESPSSLRRTAHPQPSPWRMRRPFISSLKGPRYSPPGANPASFLSASFLTDPAGLALFPGVGTGRSRAPRRRRPPPSTPKNCRSSGPKLRVPSFAEPLWSLAPPPALTDPEKRRVPARSSKPDDSPAACLKPGSPGSNYFSAPPLFPPLARPPSFPSSAALARPGPGCATWAGAPPARLSFRALVAAATVAAAAVAGAALAAAAAPP